MKAKGDRCACRGVHLGLYWNQRPTKSQETMPMSNSLKTRKHDSHVDAWAIGFMIVVVMATAVYWFSRG